MKSINHELIPQIKWEIVMKVIHTFIKLCFLCKLEDSYCSVISNTTTEDPHDFTGFLTWLTRETSEGLPPDHPSFSLPRGFETIYDRLIPLEKPTGNLFMDELPTTKVTPLPRGHTKVLCNLNKLTQPESSEEIDTSPRESWSEDIEQFREPYMKIVLPNANHTNVTWHRNMSMQAWFNFDDRSYHQKNPDLKGINVSTKFVHQLLEEEIKNGTSPERIIIGGSAQGAILALYSALTFHKRLGAIILLSPWKPIVELVDNPFKQVNKNLPIFQTHFVTDAFIHNDDFSNMTRYILNEKVSDNVFTKSYYPTFKLTSDEEFADLKKFCKKYVAPI